MKINIFILSVFLLCAQGFAVRAEAEAPWYNTSWAYRTKVTIDHNKVASTTSTLLTNFPTLINTTIAALKDTSNSGHVGQSDGGDILFTSSDGVTKLNHEIEKYTPGTGELIAWVQVPTISTSTNTEIYMYYGNATVADQWNVAATWDSNFKGVWHLDETGTNPVVYDSTTNGENSTAQTWTPTIGPIGGAGLFNGTTQQIVIPDNALPDTTATRTMSAWVHKTSLSSGDKGIMGYGTNTSYEASALFVRGNNGGIQGCAGISNWNDWGAQSSFSVCDSHWHLVVGTMNSGTMTLYVDGEFMSTVNTAFNTVKTGNAYIGNNGTAGQYFSGSVDEVRVSSIDRSADWIKTEYNNQSSPSTFYSVASENSQPFLKPMMSSLNYQIKTDSINIGGTENSIYGELVLSDTLGEVGTGVSSSSNYSVSAGYRMLQGSYISISSALDITMPAMSGMISGESNSSESWIVKTDNSAGYEMMVRAETSPALKSDYGFFSDYTPAVTNTPDYIFNVGAASSTFAFSPEGIDISQKYLDNGLGSACGTGNTDTQDRCWDGFSTTEKVVAHRTSSNHPLGTATTIKYKTAIGSNKIQESGTYTSTIVVTAVAL